MNIIISLPCLLCGSTNFENSLNDGRVHEAKQRKKKARQQKMRPNAQTKNLKKYLYQTVKYNNAVIIFSLHAIDNFTQFYNPKFASIAHACQDA